MNVGQILETHLGWAGRVLGFEAKTPVFQGATENEVGALLKLAGLSVGRARHSPCKTESPTGEPHDDIEAYGRDGGRRSPSSWLAPDENGNGNGSDPVGHTHGIGQSLDAYLGVKKNKKQEKFFFDLIVTFLLSAPPRRSRSGERRRCPTSSRRFRS